MSSALSFHILRGTEWGAAMPPTTEPPVAMSNAGFPGCRTISQHLNDLKKENFSLKLRIYFLEEKIQQKFEESSDGVHKRVSVDTHLCFGSYQTRALDAFLHRLCSPGGLVVVQSCRFVFDSY